MLAIASLWWLWPLLAALSGLLAVGFQNGLFTLPMRSLLFEGLVEKVLAVVFAAVTFLMVALGLLSAYLM